LQKRLEILAEDLLARNHDRCWLRSRSGFDFMKLWEFTKFRGLRLTSAAAGNGDKSERGGDKCSKDTDHNMELELKDCVCGIPGGIKRCMPPHPERHAESDLFRRRDIGRLARFRCGTGAAGGSE
jgi:hypothetical protein